MDIGFTVFARPTGVEIEWNDQARRFVSLSQQGNDVAVLMGHLYYQQDLLSRIATVDQADVERNEAALALAAYRSLGVKGFEHLEGDFALVIWDSVRARLLGVRDPLGGYPLFWLEKPSLQAFSTSLQPLLSRQGKRVLNREYCAEFLMMPAQWNEVASESCAYEGISRVLPGTLVALSLSAETERRPYWNWQIRAPETNDLSELGRQFEPLLRNAVRERVRGTALAHLSGGMDSTSIALLAGELAHSGQVEHPVHTMSLVYERFPDLKRESPYIEEALQHARGILPHRVAADELLDYDSFGSPPYLEEPFAGLWRLAMDRASLDLAAEVGANSVLTGIGADELHHFLPFHLADTLRQGRLLQTWSEASRWARNYNCSPWVLLREYAIRPDNALWLTYRRLTNQWSRGLASLASQDDWTTPPWIVPAFAHRYELRDRAFAHARRRFHPKTALSEALKTLSYRPGDALRWSVAVPLGIHYAHPFFDARVLSFGLGILSRIKPEPGQMKPILAEAMKGILPSSIRNRRSKVGTNAVYFNGLSRNLHDLEGMLQSVPEVAWEIFDRDGLLLCLREASLAGSGVRKLQRLNYTLCFLRWLCTQEEPRKKGEATGRFHIERT